MWELLNLTSRRELSARRIFTYALTALIAAFLWVLLTTTTTFAADASWNGSTIKYEGNSYNGPATDKTVTDLDLLSGTKVYTYVEPASSAVGSASSAQRKIYVIYFASDVDSSTATGAKYKTYIYQGPSSFSDPSSATDISISQQTAIPSQGTTSCDVTSGIGWMICPITNFLASGMDWIFDILSGFLAVRPVETGQDTSLFRAWTYMRSFANFAFVIGFLIIIYSQLTNIGITNYSIKKLLPRLIIAALLVNLSYYICSVAVDLSNVLGYSIQDIFIMLRNSLVGTEGNSWDVVSWTSITSFILSGGTIAAAGTIGLVSTLSTYGIAGSIFLLLPALVTALVAVLVALLIMAARQAIITILIILAPLAFVAYLLPNTEKWFDKWRQTFMTMLILFPAFSLVFGGSQLAATAIIQNADSINMIILGLLVQVAPLFITPLLIRLSGSLLGRIAGLVNNPNKGIVDRTRKFADDRAGNIKARRLGETARPGQFLRRNAQRVDHNRVKRESWKKIHEDMSANRFNDSLDNELLHEASYETETDKKRIEQRLERDLQIKIKTTPVLLAREMEVRVLGDEAATAKARLDTIHENLRAGQNTTAANGVLSALSQRSESATRNLAVASLAAQSAKLVQQGSLTQSLESDQALRQEAAGIDTYRGKGEKRILSNAISQIESEKDTLVKNIKIASDIKPGDVTGLTAQFEQAVRQGDAEGMRAYTDLLVESANPGVIALRKVIASTEATMPADAMSELKAHINASGPINGAAEDIASWSRDAKSRDIKTIANDKKTWEGLTATGFASMKKSSQEAALLTGGVSQKTAQSILGGPAFQGLKPDMKDRIEYLANGQAYTTGIEDPFKP